jgi:hypothetical protein
MLLVGLLRSEPYFSQYALLSMPDRSSTPDGNFSHRVTILCRKSCRECYSTCPRQIELAGTRVGYQLEAEAEGCGREHASQAMVCAHVLPKHKYRHR